MEALGGKAPFCSGELGWDECFLLLYVNKMQRPMVYRCKNDGIIDQGGESPPVRRRKKGLCSIILDAQLEDMRFVANTPFSCGMPLLFPCLERQQTSLCVVDLCWELELISETQSANHFSAVSEHKSPGELEDCYQRDHSLKVETVMVSWCGFISWTC